MNEHDQLTFDQLKSSYSFGKTSDRRNLFTNMLIEQIRQSGPNPTVLDIGCGNGMGVGEHKFDFVRRVKQHAGQLWGIEPDPTVVHQPGLFDRIETATLEDCQLPDRSIDVAFSHCVMEHVEQPSAFFQRLERLLKPTGVYFFLTPNGNSYFVKIARLLHYWKSDEWMLNRLKDKKQVEDYHYPVCYLCNSPQQIEPIIRTLGMKAEYGYYERWGAASYFPGPLKPILWLLNAKRRWWRQPRCLINLVVKISRL